MYGGIVMRGLKKIREHGRLVTQILFIAFTNGYIQGFLQKSLYKGKLKQICVPGLNCYSCPGALGACPIGATQAVLGDKKHKVTFYLVGFFMMVGAIFGRFICGWLCPFGMVQDLLYKIPFPWKRKSLPFHKYLRYLKYIILAVFVIILPLVVTNVVGMGQPWFCKWICPSGTLLGGIPQILLNPSLRSAIGFLFSWKIFILVTVVLLSIITYRPFCKYLCPLGAVYSFFNPIALYRYQVDKEKCTDCGLCEKKCNMEVEIRKNINGMECIRCGECKKACPHQAIIR